MIEYLRMQIKEYGLLWGNLFVKLLFLTPRLPYPPAGGDKVTVYSHIRLLSPKVDEIRLLTIIEREDEAELARQFEAEFPNIKVETVLLPKWRSWMNCALGLAVSPDPLQVHYYHCPAFSKRARELTLENEFDACYIHLIRMMPYAREVNTPRKILCMTDCLTLRYERSAKFAQGLGGGD